MQITVRSLATTVALGGTSTLLMACGTGTPPVSVAGTAAKPAPTAPTAPTAVKEVRVEMAEWDFTASSSVAAAGTLKIVAVNKGKQTHELVLFSTDLPADKLPVTADGKVDERGGITLIDEVENVEAGATKDFSPEVKPGRYVLVCNTLDKGDAHYGHKMYAPLTVT